MRFPGKWQRLKREKKDADHLITEMREVGDQIKALDDELREVEGNTGSYFVKYSKHPS